MGANIRDYIVTSATTLDYNDIMHSNIFNASGNLNKLGRALDDHHTRGGNVFEHCP